MFEEIWQSWCEFLVVETYSESDCGALHNYLRSCYSIMPNPVWTEQDVISNGILNATTLAAHYIAHTDVPPQNLLEAIRSYNRQYQPSIILSDCADAETHIFNNNKDIEAQFAYIIKYNCSIDNLFQSYKDIPINFDKKTQEKLLGIAWRFEDINGVQALTQAFNRSIWHREMVHSYRLHNNTYYQSFISEISDTSLRSVLKTVFLATPKYLITPSYNSGPCATLFSYVYTDMNDTQFIGFQTECENAATQYSVRELIEYINIYLKITNGRIKIYITKENIIDSVYSPPHLGDPIKHEIVFVSAKDDVKFPLLLHELGHLFLHKLFRYQERPYTRYDERHNSTLYSDFALAKDQFVQNFCSSILNIKHSLIGSVSELTSIDIVLAAKAHFHFSLDEKHLAQRYFNSKEVQMLLRFSSSASMQDKFKAAEIWAQEKWGPNYKEVIYFIHRVFDWSNRRGIASQDSELLNRLPELQSHIKDQRVLVTLFPLDTFWKNHISSILKSNDTFPNDLDIKYSSSQTSLSTTVPVLLLVSAIGAVLVPIMICVKKSLDMLNRRSIGRRKRLSDSV